MLVGLRETRVFPGVLRPGFQFSGRRIQAPAVAAIFDLVRVVVAPTEKAAKLPDRHLVLRHVERSGDSDTMLRTFIGQSAHIPFRHLMRGSLLRQPVGCRFGGPHVELARRDQDALHAEEVRVFYRHTQVMRPRLLTALDLFGCEGRNEWRWCFGHHGFLPGRGGRSPAVSQCIRRGLIGGQARADNFFVIPGKDMFVGESRMGPADTTAAPELLSRGFEQFGATDLLESPCRQPGYNQLAAIVENPSLLAVADQMAHSPDDLRCCCAVLPDLLARVGVQTAQLAEIVDSVKEIAGQPRCRDHGM